jgi:hypothetical protein
MLKKRFLSVNTFLFFQQPAARLNFIAQAINQSNSEFFTNGSFRNRLVVLIATIGKSEGIGFSVFFGNLSNRSANRAIGIN